ncbi:hypothetical protein NMY22_g538 [Coprinellus aureogranulatus]|nr:hypothetical protein NMY22_g538 [Coprinellus aureogranulatus]
MITGSRDSQSKPVNSSSHRTSNMSSALRRAPRIAATLTRALRGATNSSIYVAPRRPAIASRKPFNLQRYATSVTPQSSPIDPAEAEALRCLEQGTAKLEDGDVHAAKELYQRSVDIKRNASSLFNLGVTHYHLSVYPGCFRRRVLSIHTMLPEEYDEAIKAWKESIALQPSSPDAHTNLASAYIISPVPRPDLALHHLEVAESLCPEDPEILFNYAAVLEATGNLERALEKYKLSKQHGVERAAVHIRNVRSSSDQYYGVSTLPVEQSRYTKTGFTAHTTTCLRDSPEPACSLYLPMEPERYLLSDLRMVQFVGPFQCYVSSSRQLLSSRPHSLRLPDFRGLYHAIRDVGARHVLAKSVGTLGVALLPSAADERDSLQVHLHAIHPLAHSEELPGRAPCLTGLSDNLPLAVPMLAEGVARVPNRVPASGWWICRFGYILEFCGLKLDANRDSTDRPCSGVVIVGWPVPIEERDVRQPCHSGDDMAPFLRVLSSDGNGDNLRTDDLLSLRRAAQT